MKIILSGLLLLLLCTQAVNAQTNTTLQVSLASAKNDSLNNITVQLFHLPDTSLINSKIFTWRAVSFAVTRFSKYIIRISSTGFESAQKLVGITDKPVTVTITVKRKVTLLKNVVVVSRKPLVKQEDDNTVVDAEVMANSSTNAFEVLEKTPGAIIDQDGNVYLNSNSPATVQINGREIKLSPADLASLLKSLPASRDRKSVV